jgi:hypothetical protein
MMINVSGREQENGMEKIVKQGILYDFYGELLTSHQRRIYEDAVYNDLSLSEIAEDNGISRQGVHDLLKRCDKALADYENKLHLVEKFTHIKQKVEAIERLTAKVPSGAQQAEGSMEALYEAGRLAREILEEL